MSSEQESTDTPPARFRNQVSSTVARKLYLDVDTADVHFVFNSGERVPAHKCHLIAASDVFRVMFNGSWKERDEVNIEDTSADGFRKFLQFLYCTDVTVTMTNIREVINLAKMYDIPECLSICCEYLEQNITNNNVCDLYDIAIFYEQQKLINACKFFIRFHAAAVLETAGFLRCHRRVLKAILEWTMISCSESKVFKAVMSWVKAASGQEKFTKDIIKAHLDGLFYKIRFRSMTLEEFADLLPAFGHLFTADEYCEIIQMIRNQTFVPNIFSPLNRKPAISFRNLIPKPMQIPNQVMIPISMPKLILNPRPVMLPSSIPNPMMNQNLVRIPILMRKPNQISKQVVIPKRIRKE